jgi:hypothetical protein
MAYAVEPFLQNWEWTEGVPVISTMLCILVWGNGTCICKQLWLAGLMNQCAWHWNVAKIVLIVACWAHQMRSEMILPAHRKRGAPKKDHRILKIHHPENVWGSGNARKIDVQLKDINIFWFDSDDEYHIEYVKTLYTPVWHLSIHNYGTYWLGRSKNEWIPSSPILVNFIHIHLTILGTKLVVRDC